MSSLNHVEIATWQFKALQQATVQKRSHLAFGSAVLGFASSEGQLANGAGKPASDLPTPHQAQRKRLEEGTMGQGSSLSYVPASGFCTIA